MYKSECLDQINIQSKLRSDGARDLRDFDRMSQAISEMIRVAAGKNLGLSFQASERTRVNNTVAVTLKVITVSMRRLRVTTSE